MYYGYEAQWLVIENINHGGLEIKHIGQSFDADIYHIIYRAYTQQEALDYRTKKYAASERFRAELKKCYEMEVK